jgi:hypothetical protein
MKSQLRLATILAAGVLLSSAGPVQAHRLNEGKADRFAEEIMAVLTMDLGGDGHRVRKCLRQSKHRFECEVEVYSDEVDGGLLCKDRIAVYYRGHRSGKLRFEFLRKGGATVPTCTPA